MELNGQYGSQEDFRRAIEELKRLFPDEDTVTDDVEHLEEHGFSENDYHPGEHLLDLMEVRVGGGSGWLSGWDGVCRLETVRGRVPGVDGGCGQDRQDGCQVQDACRSVLGGHQFRGTFPRGKAGFCVYLGTRCLTDSLAKPSVGGICVDMSKMDRIIEIHGGYPRRASGCWRLMVILPCRGRLGCRLPTGASMDGPERDSQKEG